jgi:hypothetical protein
MSVKTIKERLELVQEGRVATEELEAIAGIEGVNRAYARGPISLPPSDLPIFVNFTGPASEDWRILGETLDQESRAYIMRLYVRPWLQGIDGEAEELCEPFFERVRDRFASRPGLGLGAIDTQLPGIDAVLLGDSGVVGLRYPVGGGDMFIGIEFRLQVMEIVKRKYDPGE